MTTLRRHLALVAPLLLALSSEPPLGGQLGPVGTQFWSAGSPDLVTSPQALALLGSALAAGDFDCDGFDDLAVGVPDDEDNNGALADVGFVLMVYGGAGGLVAADHQVWDQQSVEQEVEEVGDGFGFALAVGVSPAIPGMTWRSERRARRCRARSPPAPGTSSTRRRSFATASRPTRTATGRRASARQPADRPPARHAARRHLSGC